MPDVGVSVHERIDACPHCENGVVVPDWWELRVAYGVLAATLGAVRLACSEGNYADVEELTAGVTEFLIRADAAAASDDQPRSAPAHGALTPEELDALLTPDEGQSSL
jgi:hypothetical protein